MLKSSVNNFYLNTSPVNSLLGGIWVILHPKWRILLVIMGYGRAIAEAVSRWLPTAAARVQSRVWLSGICGGQSGVGAGILRILRFPLPFIPPNSPSSQSPGAGTIGQ
jgi:hypothetical protein